MEWAGFLAILGVMAVVLGGALDRFLIFFLGKRKENAVKKRLELEQKIRDSNSAVDKAQEDLDASAERIRKRIIELRSRVNSQQGDGRD